MFEYTVRKNYSFVASVSAPIFLNSYMYINIIFLSILTPGYSCPTPSLFFGVIYFLFAMNFILLTRKKTKKYLPISHRIKNYQPFLGSIIIYQLMQGRCPGQCPHSNNPPEKGLRKTASAQNGSVSNL